MTSDRTPEPDPRRKRALYIGGAIVLAAIVWNIEDWNDDPVEVTVMGDREDIHEARDAIREAIRDEVRAGFRDDGEPAEAATDETADAGEAGTPESEEKAGETADGERRIVETASGDNQRSFRIEGDDGSGVTISIDTDGTN
ncbi:MAG: hypothetical protein ACTS1X_13790 [Parasphingopyxis sp.]|uniref:hypothetical protein n=1 Tax=Parasphingopyxis sp. TaxID=1920299 RepID=UPI003F9F06BD